MNAIADHRGVGAVLGEDRSSVSSDAVGNLWQIVDSCPACGAVHSEVLGRLSDPFYMFGDERIDLPGSGIALRECGRCHLVFKNRVPSPASLNAVMTHEAGKKWMEPYDFRNEAIELVSLLRDSATQELDVLDIGACNGALLQACQAQQPRGRKSALDVVKHPGLEAHVSGEFICAAIDAPQLEWSGEAYAAVTALDVLEHLYDPQFAFANLRQLVRDGGLLLLETGDVESAWPQEYGAPAWWYVRLYEHHIFWSQFALTRIAEQFGFEVLSYRRVRHKARLADPLTKLAIEVMKVGLYRALPQHYTRIAPWFGKYWTQPWSPFTHDHMRVVLRKY